MLGLWESITSATYTNTLGETGCIPPGSLITVMNDSGDRLFIDCGGAGQGFVTRDWLLANARFFMQLL